MALISLQNCANQIPPGGGDEDKEPPAVKSQKPTPNKLNYRGNKLTLEFSEYVDRRSFQDAFRISPPMKGDISFQWSGKEVEVVFEKPFYKIDRNKTFVVTIGSALKDIHGIALTAPITYAFSTGSKIDKASVSGIIFNTNKAISIFAYKLDDNFDPAKNLPDYATESSSTGAYKLESLSPGKYRVICVSDEDRNFLFTTEGESYGVLPHDIELSDSTALKDVNFFVKDIFSKVDSLNERIDYFKDSLDIVSTSVKNGFRKVVPDQSIYILFKRFIPTREDFVNTFQLKDEKNEAEKTVFLWKNDSLVEVFPANKFGLNKTYTMSFTLRHGADSSYDFKLRFATVSANSFGEVTGAIKKNSDNAVSMILVSGEPRMRYLFEADDTVFTLPGILEAEYLFFAYLDKNQNGVYDHGNPYPFQYSEPFYFYPLPLKVKGGWAVENVVLDLLK